MGGTTLKYSNKDFDIKYIDTKTGQESTCIDIGDYIVIHDTGAHGYSMGYNYNGKMKSAELLLKEDGSVEMIRRAVEPKDYFATLDCTPFFKDLV